MIRPGASAIICWVDFDDHSKGVTTINGFVYELFADKDGNWKTGRKLGKSIRCDDGERVRHSWQVPEID